MLTILKGDMRSKLYLTQSSICCASFKRTAAVSAFPKGWLNIGRKFPEWKFTLGRSIFKNKTRPKFNRRFLHQLPLETVAPMQKIFLSNIFNAVPLHEDRRGILSRQKVKVKEVLSLPNFTDAHKGKKKTTKKWVMSKWNVQKIFSVVIKVALFHACHTGKERWRWEMGNIKAILCPSGITEI